MRSRHTSIVAGIVVGFGLFAVGVLGAGCAAATPDDEGGSAGSEVNAGPAFLADAQIADLIKLAPTFPFGVTERHAAKGPALDAHWGRHGGPLVTTQATGSPQKVSRWTLPTGVTDAATKADVVSFVAPNLPAQTFWGVDGFLDLPFGSFAMNAYSSSGDGFPGEILLYTKDYDSVVGRAHVNGFYSGTGIANGQTSRFVYSGLSGLTTDASTDNETALYASDLCTGSPAPSGSCAASVKLFGWQGNSGPVTVDADGNVFVAAFVTAPGVHGATTQTDVVYGLTKTQSFATRAETPATISQKKSGGTASIAAITTPGSKKGWIIAKGHDDKQAAPSYAMAYTSDGDALAVSGTVVDQPIAGASPDASLSFFADPKGNLWVAVELPSGSTFLALSPRP